MNHDTNNLLVRLNKANATIDAQYKDLVAYEEKIRRQTTEILELKQCVEQLKIHNKQLMEKLTVNGIQVAMTKSDMADKYRKLEAVIALAEYLTRAD